jgi:hypothetical protein
MFLGYPDPLLRCTDPDLDPLSSNKNSKKNLDSYCFVTSLCLFIFVKNYVNVAFKSNKQKTCLNQHFRKSSNDRSLFNLPMVPCRQCSGCVKF